MKYDKHLTCKQQSGVYISKVDIFFQFYGKEMTLAMVFEFIVSRSKLYEWYLNFFRAEIKKVTGYHYLQSGT